MKKEEKKEKNIWAYYIKMIFVFIIVSGVVSLLSGILLDYSIFYKYGTKFLAEAIYAIFVLVVMLLFHNSYVFTGRKEGFKKSLKYGIPIIAITIYELIINILGYNGAPLGNIITAFFFCISVGFAEEFLCRGWLQNEFIERFGDTKKNVITSILLASSIFALMHAANFLYQDVFQTMMQIINAFGLGILLGTIYYKTKNIWSVIFLHAAYDFAIFLGEVGYVKDCTYGTLTNSIALVTMIEIFLLGALWILGSIYVLKKCNFPDVKSSRKKNSTIILSMAIIFLLFIIPYGLLVPEYKDYLVCYNYVKIEDFNNYTTHYPHYERYYINSNRDDIVYSTNGERINEIITNSNHAYEFRKEGYSKLIIKNINTAYEKIIEYDGVITDFQVVENQNKYYIAVLTNENESTIYYSDYMMKENLSNENEFLNDLEASFVKFELPEMDRIGYVTFSDNDEKYVFMESKAYDHFIIKNGSLYLIDEN